MFTANKVVTSQEELEHDVNRLLRQIGFEPKLNTFMSGVISLKWKVGGDDCPTAYTNGREVYIGLDFWNINTDAQKIGLMFHEMLHCLWIHFHRMRGCDPMVANVACDIPINNYIDRLSKWCNKIALPANPPGGEIIMDASFGDTSEEMIYNQLMKEKQEYEEECEGGEDGDGDGDDDGDGDGSGPAKRWKRVSVGGFTEEEAPEEGEGEGDEEGDGVETKPLRDKPQESLKDKWTATQQKIAQIARLRGDCPAGLLQELEKIPPKVDWVTLLQRFILNSSPTDVSEEVFDRRLLSDGLYVEAIDRPEIKDMVFAIDTSGSMYDYWLNQSKSEIPAAMRTCNIKRVWVMDNDAAIGDVECYNSSDQIKFTAKGRGGTDFRPPFEWVKQHCPTNPACMVFFTDGWGPFPETPPPYPVLWMTFGLEPEKYPFGSVIDMRPLINHNN